jgi:drug/metabolite transporter (DMT)-like permease
MSKTRVSIVLCASVAAISTAAVLVRLVPDMHPLAIAFWRTTIAASLLSWALFSPGRPKGRKLLWTLAAGLCLALHFWAWFASLQLTTVMRSTVLVCLTPVWAGLWAWRVDPPSRRFWGGVGIALIGVIIMGLSGTPNGATSSLDGDLLAVVGGVLSGTYLTIGRKVRPTVDWAPYGAVLCASCAAWLLCFAYLTGTTLWVAGGPSEHVIWILVAMALGPQLIGHIGFTFAVRYVPAYVIGAVILLEPVGATVLGLTVLNEWPSPQETLGALVIVLGVMGATIKRNTNSSGRQDSAASPSSPT